jgi:hypothetical protein
MSASEALKEARSAGIELTVDGDDLVLRASAPPPAAVLDLLSRHKPDIVALLRPSGVGRSVEVCSALMEKRSKTGGLSSAPLSDGRLLYRFCATEIPSAASEHVTDLMGQARWYGVVLVADGQELIVVERQHCLLPHEVLQSLQDDAGAIIAALRGEPRAKGGARRPGLIPHAEHKTQRAASPLGVNSTRNTRSRRSFQKTTNAATP